ncbi:MAG: ester cyclase [Ktedonobacteraceae bacterium]|nr:ester cyclase [Ktedonobacteraceae bacterium]MBO0790792.1 ester cyclase [Ktedonobacteraceae bacterium]
MTTEERKALVRRVFEQALNQGKLELVNDLFSPTFTDHSTPEQAPGQAGVREYFAQVRTGFPDIQVSIDTLLAEGEMVAVRTTWRGTHRGTYEGVAATGKPVERTLIQIFRLQNGKLVEEWNEGSGLLDSL